MSTPKEAVKHFCMQCLGLRRFDIKKVSVCDGDSIKCTFFPYRLGNKRISVKMFRQFCMKDCMDEYRDLVDSCKVEDCPNHIYRFGKNPARKRLGDHKNLF